MHQFQDMISISRIIFWISSFVVMTMFFSLSLDNWTLSFYFVSLLFPVIVGSSMYFNGVLVPKYLLTDRKWNFAKNLIYLFIISVYLEMIVMIFSFALLANFSIDNLGQYAGDIRLLIVLLFLLTMIDSFIFSLSRLKAQRNQLMDLLEKPANKNSSFSLTINRKKVLIKTDEVKWIESLSDYVKIQLNQDELVARVQIGKLEELLPENFVRIHRAYLINVIHVDSFNKSKVDIGKTTFSFGRKYAKRAYAILSAKTE